jgi:hypothetical protein
MAKKFRVDLTYAELYAVRNSLRKTLLEADDHSLLVKFEDHIEMLKDYFDGRYWPGAGRRPKIAEWKMEVKRRERDDK